MVPVASSPTSRRPLRLKAPDFVLDTMVAKGFDVCIEWKGWLRLDDRTTTGYRLHNVWAVNWRN